MRLKLFSLFRFKRNIPFYRLEKALKHLLLLNKSIRENCSCYEADSEYKASYSPHIRDVCTLRLDAGIRTGKSTLVCKFAHKNKKLNILYISPFSNEKYSIKSSYPKQLHNLTELNSKSKELHRAISKADYIFIEGLSYFNDVDSVNVLNKVQDEMCTYQTLILLA